MLTTTKVNKINLEQISGLKLIDDCQAESISAGAFTWNTGSNRGATNGTDVASLSLEGATKLNLVNTDSNSSNPNASGHKFSVQFYDKNVNVVGRLNAKFGKPINNKKVNRAIERGAVVVDIVQGINLPRI